MDIANSRLNQILTKLNLCSLYDQTKTRKKKTILSKVFGGI